MASVIARTALSRSARFVASARRHLRVRRHYHRGRDRRTQRRQDVPHLGDLLGRCARHVQRHHGRRRQPPRVRLRRAGNGPRRQPERAGLGQRQPRPLAEGQLVVCPLQGALTLVASAPCIGSFACVTRAPPLSHSTDQLNQRAASGRLAVARFAVRRLRRAVDEPVADAAPVDDMAGRACLLELMAQPARVRIQGAGPTCRPVAPYVARDRR